MTEGRAALNGPGTQTIYINVYRTGQNQGGNYSSYRAYGYYEGNNYGSWADRTQYWSANLGGYQISGTFTIPYASRNGSILLFDVSWNRGHDGNGYGSGFSSTFCVDTDHSNIGDGCVTVPEETPPRISKVPSQPGTPSISQVQPTSFRLDWTPPGDDGGSGIDLVLVRYSLNSNPDTGAYTDLVLPAGTLSAVISGLTPGTTYYTKVFYHNGNGFSLGSGVASQRTLVADPPGMTVSTTPSGTGASVALSPPGGVSGVTRYTVERRVAGTTSPVTSTDTTTSPLMVSGLTPGTRYEWRASAWFDSYQSPWTAWTGLTQPKPNVSAGDYFDGSSADTADIDYQWTGAANASTSVAVGRGVDGWTGAADGSKPFIIQQVTGGAVGSFAARMIFQADLTSVGAWIGQGSFSVASKNAAVVGGATYTGSIYVAPSRPQALMPTLIWLTSALGFISSSVGTPVVCPGGAWTRLAVTGDAPSNAAYAIMAADDSESTSGWTIWKAGEWLQADGAMISLGSTLTDYFDGNTPDTASYDYSWEGTPNASTSKRVQLTSSSGSSSLVDPDCPPVPAPPRPPLVPSACVTDTGLWRRYWTYIPSTEVADWLTTIPTLELTTGALAERQVRVRYYQDPFNRPTNLVNPDDYCSEQVLSYIPPSTRLTLDGVTERVFAETAGGASQSADHLLYGSNGEPAEWPHLSCGIGYWVSLDVPSSSPVGNLTVESFLTQRV